jgi:hypothetical protein
MTAPNKLTWPAWPRCISGIMALALLLAHGARAQDTAGGSTVTRITTSRPAGPPPAARPIAQMQLTAYESFDRIGAGHGSRRTPLEIELNVMLAECPDDNVEIKAMHIGGWRYAVAGACDDALNRGVLAILGSATAPVVASTRPARRDDQPTVLRCDPATWRCDATAP